MTDVTPDPEAPDLTRGIPASSLVDGAMIAGRVGEEIVALVRRGEDYFAVSGTCPHYGGPLAEGIVVGDTLRCPWHHARFSLTTGEVLCPPARDGLARWRVEREGETI